MTDVLYIKGKESLNHDLEMKYSLRSLERYVDGVDRVFITGECPDYVDRTKVVYTPEEDIGCPMVNHWWKVTQTIKKTDISDNFLLMYDDIFFLDLVNASTYRTFFRGFLSQNKVGGGEYQQALKNTAVWLKKNGIAEIDFEEHAPIIYNREKFLTLEEIFEPLKKDNFGLAVRSIYGNKFVKCPIYRPDLKIREATERVEDIPNWYDCFSVSDRAFSCHVQPWLESNYKHKGKYEK